MVGHVRDDPVFRDALAAATQAATVSPSYVVPAVTESVRAAGGELQQGCRLVVVDQGVAMLQMSNGVCVTHTPARLEDMRCSIQVRPGCQKAGWGCHNKQAAAAAAAVVITVVVAVVVVAACGGGGGGSVMCVPVLSV